MSTSSLTLIRPSRLSGARNAPWLARLTVSLITGLRRIDRWQLDRRSPQPRTAQDVLDWASGIESEDPGFAADLRGAALREMSRHEA